MTQHQKIIELCKDKGYVCQIEFWNLFIRSPHKRRSEIQAKGQYQFTKAHCSHGVKNSFDYLMIEIPREELVKTHPEPKQSTQGVLVGV